MKRTFLAAVAAAIVGLLAAGQPAVAATKPMPGSFTGYAFDTCEAPTQEQMDVWRTDSPYWGVGVYIAGANRTCKEQTNLTPAWVSAQAGKGWRILPITVGRQASCYNPAANVTRIDPDPAPDGKYAPARAQGRAEAGTTVDASVALGLGRGTTQWLDIEDFDIGNTHCRRSMLAFLSGWTSRLHKLGYKSGLYSSAGAGITAIEGARTLSPGSYQLPDQVWFAHFNGGVNTQTPVLAKDAWRRQRIHQYAGDVDDTFGGVTLAIDRNWMDIGGGTRAPNAAPHCGVRIDFTSYGELRRGDSGSRVTALQCLLKQKDLYEGALHGRYDLATKRAVTRFQRLRDSLADTGVCTRSTWVSLLAAGARPFVKVGAGSDAVRRLQRALNAAGSPGLTVSGVFDRKTETAVKSYQASVGQTGTGTVAGPTWLALQDGLR